MSSVMRGSGGGLYFEEAKHQFAPDGSWAGSFVKIPFERRADRKTFELTMKVTPKGKVALSVPEPTNGFELRELAADQALTDVHVGQILADYTAYCLGTFNMKQARQQNGG